MITEKNTIKCEFSDFEKVQKAVSRTFFICSLVALIVGCVGVLAYIIVGTVWETLYGSSPAWCEALLVFAVPLGFGIVFVLAVKSQIKQSKKLEGTTNAYEFFSDCLIIHELHGGVETGVARADYKKIIKTSQKGQYLLIRFLDRNSALPVDTATLSGKEINTVKNLLSLKLSPEAETLELANYSADNAEISLTDKQN